MKKIIFISSIFLLLLACENPKKTNQLVLSLDVLIQKTDSINVYYTSSSSINFTDINSFWLRVNGDKKNQKLQIAFPDSIKPKQIRIDFGRNIKQSEIVLNEITLSYKKNRYSFKGEEIYNLFRIDESNTSLDKFSGTLKRKNPHQINGPSLYPKGNNLYNKLNKIYTIE